MKQNVSAFPEVSARRIQMTKNKTFLKKRSILFGILFFLSTFAARINKTFFYENNNGKYILLVAPLTTPKVVRGTQPCVDT